MAVSFALGLNSDGESMKPFGSLRLGMANLRRKYLDAFFALAMGELLIRNLSDGHAPAEARLFVRRSLLRALWLDLGSPKLLTQECASNERLFLLRE